MRSAEQRLDLFCRRKRPNRVLGMSRFLFLRASYLLIPLRCTCANNPPQNEGGLLASAAGSTWYTNAVPSGTKQAPVSAAKLAISLTISWNSS